VAHLTLEALARNSSDSCLLLKQGGQGRRRPLATLPRQFLESVRNFIQLACLVIPPIHSVGVAIRLRVGQENKLVAATIVAYGERFSREVRPFTSRYRFADNVITSSREPLSVAVIEDRIQPPMIGSRGNLAAVVATHLGEVSEG